jgi:copper chaperone CopZ
VRVAVLKLDGVESVEVSLERGLADVRLRAGNSLTIEQLRTTIKRNGFVPGSATVEVAGRLVTRGAGVALAVTGSNAVLTLASDPDHKAVMQDVASHAAGGTAQSVVLTGLLVAGTKADADRIEVLTVKGLPGLR